MSFSCRLPRLAVLAFSIAAICPLGSAGEINCVISQYTDEVSSDFAGPSLSLGSPWMSFSGKGNLAKGSSYDVFLGNVDTGTIENLTNISGYDGNSAINSDGTRIAFESETNLTGDNPDGNREIVLLDRATGEFTQLTDSTWFGNFQPAIDVTGTRVVFLSANDLVGQNPSNVFQVFLFDTESNVLSQLTHLESSWGDFGINATADLLVFAAEDDLTGGNPEGNSEIFLLDLDTEELSEITETTEGSNHGPTISMDGQRIAFRSTSQDLVGSNPDGLPEVVVYDRCNGIFTQLSDATPNSCGAFISPDGNRVLAGLNWALVLYDVPVGHEKMVLPSVGINDFNSSNVEGSLLGIRSNADPTGDNPDNSFEIFLARCQGISRFADGFECGDASEWSCSVGIPARFPHTDP